MKKDIAAGADATPAEESLDGDSDGERAPDSIRGVRVLIVEMRYRWRLRSKTVSLKWASMWSERPPAWAIERPRGGPKADVSAIGAFRLNAALGTAAQFGQLRMPLSEVAQYIAEHFP